MTRICLNEIKKKYRKEELVLYILYKRVLKSGKEMVSSATLFVYFALDAACTLGHR